MQRKLTMIIEHAVIAEFQKPFTTNGGEDIMGRERKASYIKALPSET